MTEECSCFHHLPQRSYYNQPSQLVYNYHWKIEAKSKEAWSLAAVFSIYGKLYFPKWSLLWTYFQNSTLPQQESVSFPPLPFNFSRIHDCFHKHNTAEVMSRDSQGCITRSDNSSTWPSLRLRTLMLEDSHHALKKPKPVHTERWNGEDLRPPATASTNRKKCE